MLQRLKEEGIWPAAKAATYKFYYEQMFPVKLYVGLPVYEKLKKTIDDAKAKYKKEHPEEESKHLVREALLRCS